MKSPSEAQNMLFWCNLRLSGYAMPVLLPYLDRVRTLLADCDGSVVDFQGNNRRERCHLTALAILDLDGEWGESGIFGAQPSQLVDTSACEIISLPIKGSIVVVPGRRASGVAACMTAPDPIHHGASLAGLAAGWLAHHHAQAGITPAVRAAVLASPELLARLIVEAVVGAPTATHGDTLVGTEDVAIIALAGFQAGHAARRWGGAVRTAGRTGIATGLVVAVFRARQSCEETRGRKMTPNRH